MSDELVATLAASPFTYDEVGATAAALPAGYQHLHRSRTIRFTITAFSRPQSRAARLGGPATRVGQLWMTRRYLRALD